MIIVTGAFAAERATTGANGGLYVWNGVHDKCWIGEDGAARFTLVVLAQVQDDRNPSVVRVQRIQPDGTNHFTDLDVPAQPFDSESHFVYFDYVIEEPVVGRNVLIVSADGEQVVSVPLNILRRQ
jgi:hypothetical protein